MDMNDNEQIRAMYEKEGGPEIRHGENTDTGISTSAVVKAVLVLVFVLICVAARL